MKKKYQKNLIAKANNKNQLRVLYKQVGKKPQIKIINDLSKLKKMIVKNNFEIISYEDVFIIYNNKQLSKCMPINVVFSFSHISGSLIVVRIDKINREFKSLSQEDIIWYAKDLINKSYGANKANNFQTTKKKYIENHERTFENDNKAVSFDRAVVNILINIEHALIALLKKENGDMKNE